MAINSLPGELRSHQDVGLTSTCTVLNYVLSHGIANRIASGYQTIPHAGGGQSHLSGIQESLLVGARYDESGIDAPLPPCATFSAGATACSVAAANR